MIPSALDDRVRAILPDPFSLVVWTGVIDVLNSANPIRAHLLHASLTVALVDLNKRTQVRHPRQPVGERMSRSPSAHWSIICSA